MADSESKAVEKTELIEDVEEIHMDDEVPDAVKEAAPAGVIASQLMQNPQVLAALQDRLGGMVGVNSGYIQGLPKVVKRRIKALKKLQFEAVKTEAKFYEEVHELECKYAAQYAPLNEKRREIVTGTLEPTDSDCDWSSDEEEEDEAAKLAADIKKGVTIEEVDETKDPVEGEKKEEIKVEENPSGIPEFWLTIFKNVELLAEMVQEHDEPIIKHLQDIKVKFSQSNPMGFTLDFNFSSNDYFTNTVLTKEYIMRSEPETDDPFSFEGPEIIKCKGCTIDWKKGKNVTVKTIKKKQKHKGRGTTRTVTKTVQNDSFFNFFDPPESPAEENEDDQDDDTEALLATDFEIGHFIRERIVPRAVLYFTGEAIEDDEFDEEEGEEEGEEEEGDYDEDADADYNPSSGDQKPPECKQQ